MAYLDLDEVDTLAARTRGFGTRWFSPLRFKRADYLSPDIPDLRTAVRQRLTELCGDAPEGPIRMLGHLRCLGHCFNPVVFYYGFAADGCTLTHILAEITNTPWGQRHQYALPVRAAARHGDSLHFHFAKHFHVSPFLPMQLGYDWRFTSPAQALRIHMNVDAPQGARPFDATLVLERRNWSSTSVIGSVLRFPWQTLSVMWRIYWQALRLRIKRNPFYDHPGHSTDP